MKRPQLIGLAIASTAGLVAFMMVGALTNRPPEPVQTVEVKPKTARVLVTNADIPLGRVATSGNFRWQEWPLEAVTQDFITEEMSPNAPADFEGTVARAPLMSGEPVQSRKLVKPGKGGVLSALLSPGMRAISTKIREDTAVANLVLPNDRVDVIVTRRAIVKSKEQVESAILFGNVRVLAIGQNIETTDGKTAVLAGSTATLELTSGQAEQLALANTAGEISLSLRPLAEMSADAKPEEGGHRPEQSTGSVKVFRYGTASRAYGVN